MRSLGGARLRLLFLRLRCCGDLIHNFVGANFSRAGMPAPHRLHESLDADGLDSHRFSYDVNGASYYDQTSGTGDLAGTIQGYTYVVGCFDIDGGGDAGGYIAAVSGTVCASRADPETPRPFRVPGSPALPALGVLACSGLNGGAALGDMGAAADLAGGRHGRLSVLRPPSRAQDLTKFGADKPDGDFARLFKASGGSHDILKAVWADPRARHGQAFENKP